MPNIVLYRTGVTDIGVWTARAHAAVEFVTTGRRPFVFAPTLGCLHLLPSFMTTVLRHSNGGLTAHCSTTSRLFVEICFEPPNHDHE